MEIWADWADWSRPSRACGLKHGEASGAFNGLLSRPSRACGLKRFKRRVEQPGNAVTPLAGVWIETGIASVVNNGHWRHAPRGRVD